MTTARGPHGKGSPSAWVRVAPAGAAVSGAAFAVLAGVVLSSDPNDAAKETQIAQVDAEEAIEAPAGVVVRPSSEPLRPSAPRPLQPGLAPSGRGITPAQPGGGPVIRDDEAFEMAPPVVASAPKIGQIVRPEPEIVVKFKSDPAIKEITDLFWKDPDAARAKFDALKSRSPALRALSLKRATYSGEIVLHYRGRADAEQRKKIFKDAADLLSEDPDVSYAEPNATAHPGGKE